MLIMPHLVRRQHDVIMQAQITQLISGFTARKDDY
jgi:hypothetical protein